MTQRLYLLCLFLIVSLLFETTKANAQTKAVFQIDMRPQIKDSTFIPGQSTIELTGDQLPFSSTRTIRLRDEAPIDSVYITTIHFPSLVNGKVLKYKYLIKNGDDVTTESQFHLLELNGEDQTLPPTTFNSFMN